MTAPGERGFTLLEVVVALAILGTAVVAVIQGFAQGLRLLKVSGDHQQAILLADQKMREVLIPEEEEGNPQEEGDFRWERVIRLIDAPDLAPPGSPPRWRVFEIVVRVSWDEHRSVEVATLRTVPAGTNVPGAPGSSVVPGRGSSR